MVFRTAGAMPTRYPGLAVTIGGKRVNFAVTAGAEAGTLGFVHRCSS